MQAKTAAVSLPKLWQLAVLVATLLESNRGLFAASEDALTWPVITREQRPWAYWWWMGSAVDKANLTRELTRYRDAGYGGVHIIPIYGAKGWESNYISYLSPRWMEMLRHTVSEANRLDLGVDMSTGTGWCFGGGPNVTEAEGNANVVVKTYDVAPGGALTEKFDAKQIQALVAYPATGPVEELMARIQADGSVKWEAREAAKVYAVSQKFSGQMVKRAAPGGTGPMLNLIQPEAMTKYLQPFDAAFSRRGDPKPRAQYHDSYEYKSDWSVVFFKEFEKRRGYRLQAELPALFGKATNDHSSRVLCDYRETVSDIIIEQTLPQWVNWSHDHGFLTRNEAHGSPGNLLDLYALADIPETEMFRNDRSKLISKFASSAAHVAGRKLVGCETGTWLKEHFTETLADMKYLLDDLFLSGVNHVFYHGTCYSPDEAPWPGWVFYASYEMNPRNAVWHDVRALNDYVARCQSVLQSGQPDNDILLYWPIHDFWSQPDTRLLPHLTVHARGWFEDQPIGKTAERLSQRGYSFDYVSDRQLAKLKVSTDGRIEVAGASYSHIVVPHCERLPVATLKQLVAIATAGGRVVFESGLPTRAAGGGGSARDEAEYSQVLSKSIFDPEFSVSPNFRRQIHHIGKGAFEEGLAASATNSAPRESLFDIPGLMCIRRKTSDGRFYFIANRGEDPVNRWIPLATEARSAVIMNPMSGRSGVAASRQSAADTTEVFLKIGPGESVIVRTFNTKTASGPAWRYEEVAGSAQPLASQWRVEFLSGGPALPAAFSSGEPGSWTRLGDAAARFSGTARYSTTFDAPFASPAKRYQLDLGKVVQSARVRLNGKDFGTLLLSPFVVTVDNLKPAGNLLQVEVTSTSANRIRDIDRRGVKWQNFHDINFVNQDYKPFSAADWPLADAGLLGPVRLLPLAVAKP